MIHRSIRPLLFIVGLAVSSSAQTTRMVSVSSRGVHGNQGGQHAYVSADGRYVAFDSSSTNLTPDVPIQFFGVFVHDLHTGLTTCVSVNSSGVPANGAADLQLGGTPISADGRFVVFVSAADNLVPGDTNNASDVFVHDRLTGVTTRASVDSQGNQANFTSLFASISADGTRVVFTSDATNLVPGDANSNSDVFVHDMVTGVTVLASVDSNGNQTDAGSHIGAISADGRYVAFTSPATNLVPNDTNNVEDVFVHDFVTGETTRVDVDSNGGQADLEAEYTEAPSISGDGRYVAFASNATNLVHGDTNNHTDMFVHDRLTGATTRVSVSSAGAQGDGVSDGGVSISLDGRFVAFGSGSSNLVHGDTNAHFDVFVHDLVAHTTERASVSSGGVQGTSQSIFPSISADGRVVAFQGIANNLVHGDADIVFDDAFVRDRHASGFDSACDPGANGVIACPCANAPADAGRGCDNSAATGGAALSASGSAYLGIDELVFTTRDEVPGALSVLMQGSALTASGVVFGQGVHCASGNLLSLFTKTAQSGSIRAPDFDAGDPKVSARSAALGDVIHAGETRYYFIAYRDTSVLGGCPAASTFNATQTGRVIWSP
jgi:Tol biopolymer transport system component